MILTAHQPTYLPWPGLLAKAAVADVFVILDNVSFERNSFINRNRIRTHAGWQWLTVPVVLAHRRFGPGQPRSAAPWSHRQICDIEIAPGNNWRRKHRRALEVHYGKAWDRAPSELLELYYDQPRGYISTVAIESTQCLFRAFGIKTRVVLASALDLDPPSVPYNMLIKTWRVMSGSDKILHLCQRLNASAFLFGAQARGYADASSFRAAGVEPLIQTYQPQPYTQAYPGFVPGLSALDLLLNEGPRAREIMLAGHSHAPL